MDKRTILNAVEAYVKKRMAFTKDSAHDFRHVQRVRIWALRIAKKERFTDLFLLEVAVLLHDIGRTAKTRENHYRAGERLAKRYLRTLNFFNDDEIGRICRAVYGHGPGGTEQIVKILRDADRMDLLGAIGIARCFTHLYDRPYYIDADSFAGGKWKKNDKVDKYAGDRPWARSSVDNLNFCLDHYERFDTRSAKSLAKDKIKFLNKFIRQFKKETIDLT